LTPPNREFLLGTDSLGRDVFSRIVYGSRVSLMTGTVAVTIALTVGTIIGLFAGYLGGMIDDVLMRGIDVLLAFPGLLLAIGVVAVLGPGLTNAMIAIGIARVPSFARVVRGVTLALRELDFVHASLAAGARTGRIMIRHILPNTLSSLIVLTTVNLGTALLAASSLSFLGLGAQPPTPEWGAMLSDGRLFLLVAPHVATFPGVAIALMVLGFNLLGDGLRDALDPRMKDIGRRE
jgi:peptide/nickel transport system permease protein